jgi:RNA polymerase-binding transcription factor DksA
MTSSSAQYSPSFIEEMRRRLQEEERSVGAELKTLEEHGKPRFPEYGRDEEENAQEVADYETIAATSKALEDRLAEIKAALQRIAEGQYGMTQEGEVIPEERLRANPAATTLAT